MMKADGLLAVLDRWGRATLPGAVLLFFVVLTLAPLRAPFLFQWFGFCLLSLGFVVLVWGFTALWTWTAIDPVPALIQYVVVVVIYPLIGPLLARVRARDPLNVPELSRGTARPGETTS